MINNICQICNESLTGEEFQEYGSKIVFIDYVCREKNHLFSKRVSTSGEVQLIKVRLPKIDLFVKINYLSLETTIWEKNGTLLIKLPSVIQTDFSDIDKFSKKIKMYLTFS